MDKKIVIRFVVFLLLVGFFVGGGLIWWSDAVSPVNPQDTSTKIFVVNQGDGVRTIATRLKAEGIIKDAIGFFLQVRLLNLDEKIQAGDFRLSSSMNAKTVAEELTHGSLDIWVTVLEGWRSEEIALKLAQALSIPEKEFLIVAREGYMYPDTYLLPKDASASSVARIFEKNFERRVTQELRNGIANQGLTLDEGIILASIVEREGRSDEDRPMIAGILLNRLRDDHPLQVDATLQYILGYQANEKSWWKKTLYNEDKTRNSPFNTYKNSGLPPAPISNPGLGAIQAVAKPVDTEYYYYLHDPQGGAHYAEDLDQHNENIRKYLSF